MGDGTEVHGPWIKGIQLGRQERTIIIIKLVQETWLGLTLWVDDLPSEHTLEGTGRGWRKSMCAT
jgi:hypothetical protein